ncbi:AAA family ATPase [Paraeggerthella sp.]|uniref:AAA family ATPase n=1 Tax=Paraeggerthella sp. TaxID=2897350 RepID=UPI003A8E31FA
MAVKINSLEVENVKRVKAVALEPSEDGLTVIGGRNGQGKTSVLDAIAWALGGDRKRPSDAKRDGSATDPHLRVELSNGIVVERRGKSGSLKVTDPEGRKGGQQLLDSFVESLALDLPKFLAMNDKDKARTLLGIIGVGEDLARLELEEQTLYNQRTGIGKMRDQKKSAAADMPMHPDAPAEPVSAMELIQSQQEILAKNGENQAKRQKAEQLQAAYDNATNDALLIQEQIAGLQKALEAKREEVSDLHADLLIAKKTAEQLQDESTAEIEEELQQIETVNAKVRDNQRRLDAEREAEELDEQYAEMTERIESVRRAKMDLLKGADLPLPGLAVENGLLTYQGRKWDCMSGSEQLRAATAIVRRLKPECGFVLVDKLEQCDPQTLAEFGRWAEEEGLQIIGTRVSAGDDDMCSIVIEDGYSIDTEKPAKTADLDQKWVM